MSSFDFVALENIEYDASIDLYRAAPTDLKARYAIEVRDIAGATCLSCREVEPAMIFRRVVRVGVGTAATDAGLDDVIRYMQSRGERFAIPLAAGARPAALPG